MKAALAILGEMIITAILVGGLVVFLYAVVTADPESATKPGASVTPRRWHPTQETRP